MKRYGTSTWAAIGVWLMSGCSSPKASDNGTMTVSILPLKSIVTQITDNDFSVEVLVPPGTSPETYEPTPAQMIRVANSRLIFTTGLIDFEQELVKRLGDDHAVRNRIVDLSQGIDLIAGSHAHGDSEEFSPPGGHSHGNHDCAAPDGHGIPADRFYTSRINALDRLPNKTEKQTNKHNNQESGLHRHGVDPHIWSSPAALRKMARTAYESISLLYPDSTRYTANFNNLIDRIDSTDRVIRDKTERSKIKFFLIFHPALSYWSADYGYTQIVIEHEGKEPSADHLRKIVTLAREHNINKVFYQAQFSRRTVETLAREIEVDVVEIDPLAEDAIGNILHITNLITEN